MSGVDRLLAEANQRWLQAMERARDVEDLGLALPSRPITPGIFPFLPWPAWHWEPEWGC